MIETLRYAAPTKLDSAPFGTIVSVVVDDGAPQELYIQTSKDETMHWERVGTLLERLFKDFLDNAE